MKAKNTRSSGKKHQCSLCCHSVMKKKPRIYLEKKQKIMKTPDNVKKKSKPNLKCTLVVLAHTN